MSRGQIDDWILTGVEDLADLTDPLSHASVPQKSSTQRNPPLTRYSRSRAASASLMPIVPTSDATIIGHWNSAASVSLTTQGYGLCLASQLTWIFVSSDARIIRLTAA